jgi:hypothetical protein
MGLWKLPFSPSYIFWIIPLVPLEVAALQAHGVPWNMTLRLAIPQLLMLILLKVFRARVPVLFGAAFALASQTIMCWLVVMYPPPGGQWWLVFILTTPGALIGTLLVLGYVKRVRKASAASDAIRSFLLLASAIAVNVIACLMF